MMNKKERILLYGSNLWYFGEGMFGPLFAIFSQKIGGNILDITWAWATYLIICGILVIIFGKISDHKVSKSKLMVAGYALNAVFTFCYLFVDSQLGLFIVQAGLGAAAALAIPTWEALYAKYEDKRHDGYTWGLAGGQAQIATGLAIILGGLLVNYFSFQVLFVTMGTIQIIATIYQAQILKK
jgi:MFS family permease